MKRSRHPLTLACAAAAYLCLVGAAADDEREEAALESPSFALAADGEDLALPSGPWTARVVGIPGTEPEESERRAAPGLPTFTGRVVARRRTYRFTLVGSDPSAARPRPIVVPVQIIPVRVEFNDGTVLDPTLPGPPCAGAGTPLTNTLQSPLFTDADYGEGNRQYVEENRRVEFWAMTHAKPSYSVRLAPVVLPTIVLTFDGPSSAATCGRFGVLPFFPLDHVLRTTLIPQLKRQGVSAQTFPLFLFSNVFTHDPKLGYFVGYHSSIGAQTFGIAEYDTNQLSHGAADISGLSHELAEWYDDPFVNNATPPWGHIGQVDGCQANLEVGDPLTGHLFRVTMPNGMTYHPQELAFFSWFFNQAPSLGLRGLYSWGGTLAGPALPCS